MFNFNKIIEEIGKDTRIDIGLIKMFINGEQGTKWIIENGLNCSEVELGMLLKTIRKRLSFPLRYKFSPRLNSKRKAYLLGEMFKKYRQFELLHLNFYKKRTGLKEIFELLLKNKTIIIDSGIGEDNFFRILPEFLKKINPSEIALFYAINTLMRWKIAEFIKSEINEKLFARGSLVFFNSRSFGCGNYANFSFEKKVSDLTCYPSQGSDLDLKIEILNQKILDKVEKCVKQINEELKKYDTFLTVEINEIKTEPEDLLSIDDSGLIFNVFRKHFNYENMLTEINVKNYASVFKLKKDIFKKKEKLKDFSKDKIRLTDENIKKLFLAIEKVLRYYKISQDSISSVSLNWKNSLEKAKRETDFWGLISIIYLFLIFKSLFFLSGYRLSIKEKKLLFNKTIKEYEKTKV